MVTVQTSEDIAHLFVVIYCKQTYSASSHKSTAHTIIQHANSDDASEWWIYWLTYLLYCTVIVSECIPTLWKNHLLKLEMQPACLYVWDPRHPGYPKTNKHTEKPKCLLYGSLLLDFDIQIHLMLPTVLIAWGYVEWRPVHLSLGQCDRYPDRTS